MNAAERCGVTAGNHDDSLSQRFLKKWSGQLPFRHHFAADE
jgi:hypothetical protein